MLSNLRELEVGSSGEVVLLIKNIESATTTSGELYQRIAARDMDGNEATMLKFDSLLMFTVPVIVIATVKRSEQSLKINKCQETDKYSMTDFLPKSHIDIKEAWKEIVEYIKELRTSLGRVVCAIIGADKMKFVTYPMNATGGFARQAGILEATLKLTKLAKQTAEELNLDKDLMIAAGLLYYIGNVDTIDSTYNYTKEDVLIGNGLMAHTKLQFKIRDIMNSDNEEAKEDIAREDFELLSHILISRYRSHPTAIAEAVCLSHLDSMIRETDSINESLLNTDNDSIVLSDKKRLYKRNNSSTKDEEKTDEEKENDANKNDNNVDNKEGNK